MYIIDLEEQIKEFEVLAEEIANPDLLKTVSVLRFRLNLLELLTTKRRTKDNGEQLQADIAKLW